MHEGTTASEILASIRRAREKVGVSPEELEEKLILGPGWISLFESGQVLPSLDVMIAIVHEAGLSLRDVLADIPDPDEPPEIARQIYAEDVGRNLLVRFRYANFDAEYLLQNTNKESFEKVVKTLRDGLARLSEADAGQSEALKTDAVATAFLEAMEAWPDANPSDIWWFIIYRAYCDPFNHPAQFSRLDFTQSWKRTGGWALEEVLVRHYGPYLREHGINLFIPTGTQKQRIIGDIDVGDRIEADKLDVALTGYLGDREEFFGVVHVKSSFAERRTDDVPMSTALVRAGYTSPLWTMDCKSIPNTHPFNRGELGRVHGRRSAKRRDIEDEGYFSGCFSYNQNTEASPDALPAERRVYVCNFRDPNDAFSEFIITRWQEFRSRGAVARQ